MTAPANNILVWHQNRLTPSASPLRRADKLAKMTPLERKRYRESTGTLWGRAANL
jgi:hypothetical protein